MKEQGTTKLLILLIIVAICLASFVGIYTRQKGKMINLVPDYQFAMNLKGTRTVKLVPNTSTKEVIRDAEGNETTEGKDEEGNLKEGYTKEEIAINPEEILIWENYELAKKVLEKRLQAFGVQDYLVKQNPDNGMIIMELPNNAMTDEVIANLNYRGKLQILDSETKEVLINSEEVKRAGAAYVNKEIGTMVYLSVEFKKEAVKKYEEITKTYVETTDEEGNSTTKKIEIQLDDETLTQTYFGETISNGVLQLPVGAISTDPEEISSYLHQASMLATLIDSGDTIIDYQVEENRYMSSYAVDENLIKSILYGILGIVIVSFLYLCIKYKVNGILASIASTGVIALLLLVLRYTNVIISLEAIVAMVSILVANFYFVRHLLKGLQNGNATKKEIRKETYLRYLSILIPFGIAAVVFTFATWIPLSSIGTILFWGIVLMFGYHYLLTMPLLNELKKEKE